MKWALTTTLLLNEHWIEDSTHRNHLVHTLGVTLVNIYSDAFSLFNEAICDSSSVLIVISAYSFCLLLDLTSNVIKVLLDLSLIPINLTFISSSIFDLSNWLAVVGNSTWTMNDGLVWILNVALVHLIVLAIGTTHELSVCNQLHQLQKWSVYAGSVNINSHLGLVHGFTKTSLDSSKVLLVLGLLKPVV